MESFFAGWRCAYPAYSFRRSVQAQRHRAKVLQMLNLDLCSQFNHAVRRDFKLIGRAQGVTLEK
ncbi:hypothetical protein TUM17580_20350 [Citrobacter farmeri]|nr:hypothetical protein TUM17580_20350 [Citrobacter farmeri]